MNDVTRESELAVFQLVAWELLGKADVDPKALLRRLPLTDLSTLQANINDDHGVKKFACVKMVELEVLYRRGFLRGDWHYTRTDACVNLYYDTPTRSSAWQAVAPSLV